ncbi:MAG TPA: hypothetical protein PK228_13750, partial [Saprospiraceae bacterium]|nr:hypothetical protein [Saprospiraceae bacterium]
MEQNNADQATAEGQVKGLKTSQLLQAGHCWSATTNEPVLTDPNTKSVQGIMVDDSKFTSAVSGLLFQENYFIRAYAIFESFGQSDTIYEASVKTFSTSGIEIITTNIFQDELTAIPTSFIRFPGGEPFSSFGHCWSSVNPSPSLQDVQSAFIPYGPLDRDSTFQSFI